MSSVENFAQMLGRTERVGVLNGVMDRDFFLGLACNTAMKARLSESQLERALGVGIGFLGRCERGEEHVSLTLERLLQMFFRYPEDARRYYKANLKPRSFEQRRREVLERMMTEKPAWADVNVDVHLPNDMIICDESTRMSSAAWSKAMARG